MYRSGGYTIRDLAELFSVSRLTVYQCYLVGKNEKLDLMKINKERLCITMKSSITYRPTGFSH
ncbi:MULTISPECIES: helix-turn-helix domain-containing protein [unclassified Enterobacter]|uniref:helix-turn-helix domain-containing protein n=1 Tax=unclassified Enterobacter TaxID=2608935 RepID=UPI00210DF12B|nr:MULTISPECIES: helix-turn-helix domain-containing protein [unclassified Enterobacter]